MSDAKKNQPDVEKEALADEDVSEQMQVRLDKMHKLEEKGIQPFGHAYQWTHHTKEVHDQVEAMEAAGTVVKVAGRLLAIRGHGKTCFMDLQDKTGKIQLYVRKDEMGEEAYSVGISWEWKALCSRPIWGNPPSVSRNWNSSPRH